MGYAACYSIDLYCDNKDAKDHAWDEFPHQFTAEDRAEAFRMARAAGWLFKRDRETVLCPKCRKAKIAARL